MPFQFNIVCLKKQCDLCIVLLLLKLNVACFVVSGTPFVGQYFYAWPVKFNLKMSFYCPFSIFINRQQQKTTTTKLIVFNIFDKDLYWEGLFEHSNDLLHFDFYTNKNL